MSYKSSIRGGAPSDKVIHLEKNPEIMKQFQIRYFLDFEQTAQS